MSEKIVKAYNSTKGIYDDVLTNSSFLSRIYIGVFWGVNDNEIAEKVLSSIPDDFSGRLLDVPAGTAVFTSQKFAGLKNGNIICLDCSGEMLKQAEQRFRALKADNVSCITGDVGQLCYDDESFDLVLSMNGFHAFPDKERAFSETARVLKKGGRFCGCFYIKKQKVLTDFIVSTVLTGKGWFTPPFQTMAELTDVLKYYYSEVEITNDKSIAIFNCTK